MEILIWFVVINWGGLLLLLVYPLVMKLIWKDFVFEGFYGPFGKFRLISANEVYLKGSRSGTRFKICETNAGKALITPLAPHDSGKKSVPLEELNFIEPWHAKLWRDWGGVGLGLFMCYKGHPSKSDDDAWVARTIVHEGTHCWQIVILGAVIFFLSYFLHMLWILATQKLSGKRVKYGYSKHPYLDCWAERMARRRAGQLVDVPPDQWPDGKDDLWAWW